MAVAAFALPIAVFAAWPLAMHQDSISAACAPTTPVSATRCAAHARRKPKLLWVRLSSRVGAAAWACTSLPRQARSHFQGALDLETAWRERLSGPWCPPYFPQSRLLPQRTFWPLVPHILSQSVHWSRWTGVKVLHCMDVAMSFWSIAMQLCASCLLFAAYLQVKKQSRVVGGAYVGISVFTCGFCFQIWLCAFFG